MYIVTSVVRVI